jgi:hypothetical protein
VAFAGAVSGAVTGALYHLIQPPPPISEEDWGVITVAVIAGRQAIIAAVLFLALAFTVLRFRSTDQIIGCLTAFWLGSFLAGSLIASALNSFAPEALTGVVALAVSTPLNWALVCTILGAIVASRRPG